MDQFLKILTLILISSVKFAVGPPLVYLKEGYNFTWLETNIYAIIGGMIGVIVFMHLSEWLYELWHELRLFFFHRKQRKEELFSKPVADVEGELTIHYEYIDRTPPQRKIFTKQSRRMVKIWRRYGLMGLAALTPILFSIPLGLFFMVRLEKSKKKILLYMFVSITCWSLLLTTFFELTHVRNLHEILQ